MSKKGGYTKKTFIVFGSILVLLLFVIFFIFPKVFAFQYNSANKILSSEATATSSDTVEKKKEELPAVVHLPTPKPLKAIYMSACYAGSKNLREGLAKLIDDTELNAVVIDIKDFSGKISFLPDDSWKPYLSDKCYAPDMKEFIKNLHERNIYVIGRITTFQDPFFAKLHPDAAVKTASNKSVLWHDKKNLNYLDPGAEETRKHIVDIAKASYDSGFDELNFDYIRFPSDGNMKDIYFPFSEGKSKPKVMEDFFKYLHDNLKPTGMIISIDLFGMTTTNTDDLGIGQVLETTLPYFDYIAPMVYPSHWPKGWNGFADPNKHVYEVIKVSMESAVKRTIATSTLVDTLDGMKIASTTPQLYTKESFDKNKMRPWLQDFNYGGIYGAVEVRAQIKATYDVGLDSWMLWAPSNKYTRATLNKE